jgi:hypothetical protein
VYEDQICTHADPSASQQQVNTTAFLDIRPGIQVPDLQFTNELKVSQDRTEDDDHAQSNQSHPRPDR